MLKTFLQELKRRNAFFYYLGLGFSFLFVVSIVSIGFCIHSKSDICHLLKPAKFALSFAVYVMTMGWFLEYLKQTIGEKKIKWITGLIGFFIIVEMVLIFLQSGMSTAAYENLGLSSETTALLSRILYLAANGAIILDTYVAIYAAYYFFKPLSLHPAAYLWGIRAGFVVFIASGLLGGYLVDHYGQMPIDQSELTLPFTHFSTPRNNLISLHFLGIHSLQLIPLCCYYFHRYLGKKTIFSFAFAYIAACLLAIFFTAAVH